MAQHPFVELDGPLELGKSSSGRVKLDYDVITGFVLLDGISKGPLAPMIYLGSFSAGLLDESMEAGEALIDGGLFERTVEDIDHLVLTSHDTFLWTGRMVDDAGPVAPGVVSRRGGICAAKDSGKAGN